MGRQPCCDKVGLKKGPWTAEEDKKLIDFILTNGQCCWRAVPKLAGLLRCGKSCRLRWTNYLRPDLKRGLLSEYEEKMVIDLHAQIGNRWSKIASHLPGRTDNEIKNHWNTHIKKKLKKMGIDPVTHKPLSAIEQQEQTHNTKQRNLQHEPDKEQPEKPSCLNDNALFETYQNKEHENPKQENSIDQLLNISEGPCPEEVPQPEGSLIPSYYSVPSSSSSSSFSNSSYDSSSSKFLEDFQFPDFDWPVSEYNNAVNCNNSNNDMRLWDDDFSSWDLVEENFYCSRMALDQESWTYGLF